MIVKGIVIKFADNIDTDIIIPGKYLVYTDPVKLGEHAMEGIDPNFTDKAKKGIIIVAGKNFGCGSSREQAPIALKSAGVKCILAESFARIFFRNSINVGLPILECKGVSQQVSNSDLVHVTLQTGMVEVPSKKLFLQGTRLPKFILEILSDGGLIKHLKKRRNLNETL